MSKRWSFPSSKRRRHCPHRLKHQSSPASRSRRRYRPTSARDQQPQSPRSKSSDRQSELSEPSPDMNLRQTTVVRGFSPSSHTSIPRTVPDLVAVATPEDPISLPQAEPATKAVAHHKKKPSFALGASCSSSEMGQSLEVPKPAIAVKKLMFRIGGSSEEGSLKSAMHSKPTKKQATFSNRVGTFPQNDTAIDSDTDCIDESAIDDDDDSSDWEDSVSSGKSSMDDKFFQRVDSKVNLTSRPSLITLMLAQNERAKSLGNTTSQRMAGPALGASPNDSDDGPLMMKVGRGSNLKSINETPRSSAQPIPVQPSRTHTQAALSPRTTRHNMLSTELTESLRRHLLWERQQKSSTANTVFKRRHNSHDVAELKQHPQQACIKEQEDDSNTWNKCFHKDAINDYHSKGW